VILVIAHNGDEPHKDSLLKSSSRDKTEAHGSLHEKRT